MMPLGRATTRRLDDEELGLELPLGWWIEQTGYWYVAYFGESLTIGPSVRLAALVAAVWWQYNRTGAPLNRTPARRRVRPVSRETDLQILEQTQLSLGWIDEA